MGAFINGIDLGSGGGLPISEIVDLLYPIGRGFIDFTGTDYSNWLGLTWERELVGLTPVGYDPNDSDFKTIGKTGGEKTHKLTESELANHNHTGTVDANGDHQHVGTTDGNGDHQHTYEKTRQWDTEQIKEGHTTHIGDCLTDTTATSTAGWHAHTFTTSISGNHIHTFTTSSSGSGVAHNNMQPYKVVAYWKRVK